MSVLNVWNRLQEIGLKEHLEFRERIRIELCNRFVSIGLLLVSFQLLINILFFRSVPDLIFTFIWLGLLVPGLLLNIYGHPKPARLFLVYGGALIVGVLHILFGNDIKFESMYILFVLTAALFFEYQLMARTVAFIIGLFLLATFICSFYEAPLAAYISPAGPFTRFLFSLFMIIVLIRKLIFKNEEYNRMIRQQNNELIETNQQLKSFNYIFSHDLKEPVRSIISFSQLIQRDLQRGQDLDPEYLSYVVNSGNQLNALIDGIKTFQASSDTILQKEQVIIQEVVQAVLTHLPDNQRALRPKVSCQDLPPIQSSKMALFIIFKNLIENAIKYNDRTTPEVEVTGKIAGRNLQLWVKDNGIGIDDIFLDDVFTMFRRLNSDREKGSGLGLSIVRSLLQKIGGSIVIEESRPRGGTTFLLTLPTEMAV